MPSCAFRPERSAAPRAGHEGDAPERSFRIGARRSSGRSAPSASPNPDPKRAHSRNSPLPKTPYLPSPRTSSVRKSSCLPTAQKFVSLDTERRTTPNSGSFPAARLRRAVPTRGRRSLAGASLCLVAWAPRRAPSRNCTLMRAGVQADPIMKVFPGGGRHRPPEAGETRTPDASWVPNRVLLMRLRGGICSPARHQHADRPPRSALLLVHQRHRRSSVPRRGSLSPAGAPEAAPRRPRRAAPCQLRSDGRPGRAS